MSPPSKIIFIGHNHYSYHILEYHLCFCHLASRATIICFCNYHHCPCCQHKMKLCEWSPEYKGSPLSCLIALMSPMIYPLNLKCTKPSLIDWLPPGYWSVYITHKLKAPFQVKTLLQANEQASRPAEEREAGGWHSGRPGERLRLREDRDEVRQHWHVPLDTSTQHRGLHIGEISIFIFHANISWRHAI